MAVFQKIKWSPDAERQLTRAMNDAQEVAWLKNRVDSGIFSLYQKDTGYAVIGADFEELIIVAVAGRDMIDNVASLAETLARANGFYKIRFHTKRKGFFKIVSRYGYRLREYVFERVLFDGR